MHNATFCVFVAVAAALLSARVVAQTTVSMPTQAPQTAPFDCTILSGKTDTSPCLARPQCFPCVTSANSQGSPTTFACYNIGSTCAAIFSDAKSNWCKACPGGFQCGGVKGQCSSASMQKSAVFVAAVACTVVVLL
jgi:hypothetical protein